MSGIAITVACAGPEGGRERSFQLSEGATLADALAAAHEDSALTAAIEGAQAFGVWGKVRPPEHILREGDRVEIYRPLQADPKDARRARARR